MTINDSTTNWAAPADGRPRNDPPPETPGELTLARQRFDSRLRPGPTALILGCAFLLLAAITVARSQHRSQSDALFVSDGFGYYIYLPSLVIDGDLDLTNQIARQPVQVDHWTFAPVADTGRPGNIFQVGPAVLWLPFFLAAHAILSLLHVLGVAVPRDGFGWAYEAPVYVGSFCYGLVGVLYTWRLLAETCDRKVAVAAVALTVLATPVAAYLWFEPDMSHLVSMALVAMLAFYLHRVGSADDARVVSWARLGALTGLIGLVRVPDLLVAGAVVLVGGSILVRRAQRGRPVRAAEVLQCLTAYSAAAVVCFLPQLAVWKLLYGYWFTMPPNPFYATLHWRDPDLWNYFFSTRHGMFAWAPIWFVAVTGVVWGTVRGTVGLRWWLPVLGCAMYFNASIHNWWAGCSFGERRMVDYAPLLALGLGAVLQAWPALLRSRTFVALAIIAVGFNWLLMLRYFTHDLPEYDFVPTSDLYLRTLAFPLRRLANWPI
jgi:hypothetical protein